MKRALGALAATLCTVVALDARAFVRTQTDPSDADSPCLFWGQRSVPVRISQRGSTANGADEAAIFSALRTSLQQWTDADCSDFVYEDGGLTSDLNVGYSRALLDQPMLVNDVAPQNTIIFRNRVCAKVVPSGDACTSKDNDDCADAYDCWNYDDGVSGGVIALTTTTFNYQTGQIFDGDIELNEAEFTFTTTDPPAPTCPSGTVVPGCISTDLRNTVTHESGHLLGLGHSSDPTATMYFSASNGETSKRDLAADDLSGLCAIYPTGQPPTTCNEPAAASSKGCGCGTVDGFAFAPLLLVLRRRKRGS